MRPRAADATSLLRNFLYSARSCRAAARPPDQGIGPTLPYARQSRLLVTRPPLARTDQHATANDPGTCRAPPRLVSAEAGRDPAAGELRDSSSA